MKDTIDEALEIALAAARLAGEILQAGQPDEPRRASVTTRLKSSPTDVVTEMDLAAEKAIVEVLERLRPLDGIVAEEGSNRDSNSGWNWFVDPLDGTVNYLYGSPQWCVSIAAADSEGVCAAVVHAPALALTFYARRGKGSFRIDRQGETRLGPISEVPLDQALVATGFGYRSERRRNQARVVAEVIPLVRDIRRKGSAALDLCWVASGVVNAYYERGTNAWDIKAGGLIVEEAGGVFGGLRGESAGMAMTVAAAPKLQSELVELLTNLDADLGD